MSDTYYNGVTLNERWKHLQKIRTSCLGKLFDDFDQKTKEQFDAIDAQIASINGALREAKS